MKKLSIKAHLRTDKLKEDGKCPVSLVVVLNGIGIRVGQAPILVSPDVWNKQEGCVDISKLNKNARDYKQQREEYEELNRAIKHHASEFKRFLLEQERLGVSITADKVRAFFKIGKTLSFWAFWDKQVSLMQPSLRASTLYSYENTKKILQEFRPSLEFGDINLEFVKRFDNYLTVNRGNSDGGKFSRHKNFKAILRIALREKLIEENPYTFFKIKPAKGNRMRLTLDELRQFKNKELPKEHQRLAEVKEMFLFSCYTGLRFSDVQNLKWEDVSFAEAKLEIKMVKTSDNICLPLIPDALEILKKLRGYQIVSDKAYVFKRITNQAINRSLKTIMEVAEIKKEITFHCGRHTFATVSLEVGIDLFHIKVLLGHSNITHTQIYAKNSQTAINASMNRFGQMLQTANA